MLLCCLCRCVLPVLLCAACAAVLLCRCAAVLLYRCAAVLWCCAALLYKYREILKEILRIPLQIQRNSKGSLKDPLANPKEF